MATLNWPPDEKRRFSYTFNKELTLSIPLVDNKEIKREDNNEITKE